MPNWCSNTIVFYPVKENDLIAQGTLMNLYLRLVSWMPKIRDENPSHWCPICTVIEKVIGWDHNVGRGGLEDVTITDDGKLFIYCETAWSPAEEFARTILDFLDPKKFNMHYLAEEPGMGIYINTDTTKKIFPDWCIVNWCAEDGNDDTQYFGVGDFLNFQGLIEELTGLKYSTADEYHDHTEEITDAFMKKHPDGYFGIEYYTDS